MCRYGHYAVMAFWYGSAIFFLLPSFLSEWKATILAMPLLGNYYESIVSRHVTYYISFAGLVMFSAKYLDYKLKESLEELFPSEILEPSLGIIGKQPSNPKPCEVVTHRLLPKNFKQECVFGVWVLKNTLFATLYPQILFGVLGYILG